MPLLNAAQPIVFPDLTMQSTFRDQMNLLYRNLPLSGVGSPEGVIAAPLLTLYLDATGTAGLIEYRKMLSDIAGDVTMGWVAV